MKYFLLTIGVQLLFSILATKRKSEVLRERRRLDKLQHPFEHWSTFAEIETQLKRWAKHRKDITALEVIGRSYEKRKIYSFSINASDGLSKSGVLIECGIHPREWISPAICLYLINQALNKPQSRFGLLLDSFNFYLIPVLNPDGYVYSWTEDRLWRKNRSPQKNGCIGVDLNRNFDVDFCNTGTETDPCGETYCGPGPFSELESRALRDYAMKLRNKHNLQHSFHIHSFGQKIMYPYGYSSVVKAPNHNKLQEIVKSAAKHIKALRSTIYTVGQSAKIHSNSSGGSDDWMMKNLQIPSVYCIESLDDGDNKFLLSNNQIKNASEEFSEIISYILGHWDKY